MLQVEFRKFWEEEIQSRWDGWFVSERVFEDWFKAFRNCDSEKLALAISKWFRVNEPKKPTIPKLKALYRGDNGQGGCYGAYNPPEINESNIATREQKDQADRELAKSTSPAGLRTRRFMARSSARYRLIDPEAAEWVKNDRRKKT